MKTNSLYSIMAIISILSLPFCKSNENDPDPTPSSGNGDTPGITYAKDNSPLPATITLTEGDSNGNTYAYTIVLNTQPTANVEIEISLPANSPDNLQLNSGSQTIDNADTSITLTFTADNWETSQRVSLTLIDDDIFSRDTSVTITHSSTSGDSGYDSIPDRDLVVTTKDEDTVCGQSDANSKTNFSGGNYGMGTENDPYIICNADQLQAMRDDLNAFYELGQDIDASSVDNDTCPEGTTGTCTGFQPIGRDFRNSFKGTLDGKGFTISGLTINIDLTSGESYAGLFGRTSEAKIRNIGLLNVDIDASTSASASSGSFSAGGLVGMNDRSMITNSYSTGNVSSSGSSSSAGGLVGRNTSSIINSYSTGNVSSSGFSSSAGGLVGENNGSSSIISNSYSTGNVDSSSTSGSSFAGGLAGNNGSLSSITNSYSTGNVDSSSTSGSSYAGGLAGWNTSSSSISNSYSTGNVSSSSSGFSSSAGGLVGRNTSSISNSYSTGNVSSSSSGFSSSAGGLVGENSAGSITNSYYDQDTSTLFKNGSAVFATVVASNESGTLTCVGGFATSAFIAPTTPNTGSCSPLAIFFNWQTTFDIDGNSVADEESVRYDSNNDGSVNNMDDFVWNFGSNTEYPFIASIPQTADEQAVRMASGFLRFSNTTLGRPSASDFVFFYDIGDAAMDITTSGTGVQGTAAGSYVIEDTNGNALSLPTVTNAGVINGINSLAAGAEFYLKVTFTRGTTPMASYTTRYRFKK